MPLKCWQALGLCCVLIVSACAPIPTTPPPTLTATATATFALTKTPTTPPITSTAEPTATPPPSQPEGIHIFPGPLHYEGDVLSFQWATGAPLNDFGPLTGQVKIDGGPPQKVEVQTSLNPFNSTAQLVVLNFFDTAGQAGAHMVQMAAPGWSTVTFTVEVLPASERPAQEVDAHWLTRKTDCCEIHYVSDTAAARDIEKIAAEVEASVQQVEQVFGEPLENKPFTLTFLDNVWGNSGYADEGGIVIDYVDRDYNDPSENLGTVIRHEATHKASGQIDGAENMPGFFWEGLAVYVAGGHYKTEPLPERAAALIELGDYVPLKTLMNEFGRLQHERRYLQGAAFVAYLVDTYGWNGMVKFASTRVGGEFVPPDVWMERALDTNFSVSLAETETAFKAWLLQHPPGGQVADLRLSVLLQDVRRSYQRLYAPYFDMFYFSPPFEAAPPSYALREPHAAENVALELMLVSAQTALYSGAYAEAELLIIAVQAVLDEGSFAQSTAADYYALAALLLENGYEPIQVQFNGTTAETTVTRNPPTLEALTLTKTAAGWQLPP